MRRRQRPGATVSSEMLVSERGESSRSAKSAAFDRDRLLRRLRAFAMALGVLLSINNTLPYLGLRDDSCQTMFSGLEWGENTNNHWFMPQYAVSDQWAYRCQVEVELHGDGNSSARVEQAMAWLRQPHRTYNNEALRVVVGGLCEQGYRVRMSYRDAPMSERQSVDDACEVAQLSRSAPWLPVRLYETDYELPPDAPCRLSAEQP